MVDLTSISTEANCETTSPVMLRYPVYPDNDSSNVITISLSDINRLRPDQDSNGTDMYLSDTIADFCISYMQNNSTSSRKGVFITSCLFYSHLKPLGNTGDISSAWYIRNGNLHAVNIIVIPIVTEEHFSTLVVTGIWQNNPVFYHYDSLVTYHSTHDFIELIADYLRELRRSKDGDDESDNSLLSIDPSRVIKLKGPIQRNKFDCGVFMLKFIQKILESSVSLENCLDSFNSTMWSCQDVRDYRIAMYDVVKCLYDEDVGNQNMIATQHIVRDIEENRYSTKHQELKVLPKDASKKVSIDTYILETFGTMDNYIRLVPNVNDQEYIRLIYNQNQFLLETFNAKRRTINCGVYRGEFVILSTFHFLPALSWAPNNVNCWDRIPVSYDRYPKTYGHINFAALEGPNKKTFFSSSPLGSDNDGYRYILWICHLTTCWKPIKEWTLFDTHTERFNVVKGI